MQIDRRDNVIGIPSHGTHLGHQPPGKPIRLYSKHTVDCAGGGSALRFGESGAKMSQLDVILFTHFHVDHSADFPSLIFSSWFEERDYPLPVYGPTGNNEFPSTVDFRARFFQ